MGGAALLDPGPEETLDELLRGRIRLLQPRRGVRVSLDPLLLVDFARSGAPGRALGRVLDVGCGGGVIALALAAADATASLVGLELQPAFAELARRNAALNGVSARLEIIEGNVADARALPLEPASFDLVVTNPPYQPEGGRVAPTTDRALAHHELACTMVDVIAAARRFLRPRGRLCMIHAAERLGDLMAGLVADDLRPRAVRPVHAVAGDRALRVLVEGVRGYKGGATLLPPLVIHEADRHSYTAETARILGG